MNAVSVATISPCASGSQKACGSSPLTPLYNGCVAGVATAASLRIALHKCPTTAVNVRSGWRAIAVRKSP
eukprot:2247508-Prymnesium_polylepis.1